MFEVIFAVPVTVLFAVAGSHPPALPVFSAAWFGSVVLLLLAKLLLRMAINLTVDVERAASRPFVRHFEMPRSIFGLLADVSVLQTLAYLMTLGCAGWLSPWLPIPLAVATHAVGPAFSTWLQKITRTHLTGEPSFVRVIRLADLACGCGATFLGLTVLRGLYVL